MALVLYTIKERPTDKCLLAGILPNVFFLQYVHIDIIIKFAL